MSDFSTWYKQVPQFTRYWLSATVGFSVLAKLGKLKPGLNKLSYSASPFNPNWTSIFFLKHRHNSSWPAVPWLNSRVSKVSGIYLKSSGGLKHSLIFIGSFTDLETCNFTVFLSNWLSFLDELLLPVQLFFKTRERSLFREPRWLLVPSHL